MGKRTGELETILGRNEIYQTAFRRSTLVMMGMAFVTVLSLAMGWWGLSQKPEPRYFAAREDGSIIPLVAVSQPYLNENQISNFAVEAVTTALTMDFANWRDDLAKATEYFVRPDGWDAFLAAMDGSGVLDYIRVNRLVSSAVANSAVITGTGANENGIYSWRVQVPITVTYQSSSEITRRDYTADLIISRVPTWERSRGVAIRQIIVR